MGEHIDGGRNSDVLLAEKDYTEDGHFDQRERGQISYAENITKPPSDLTLLANAELSTVLHEICYFYLEVATGLAAKPNSPIRSVDGINAETMWLGYPSRGKY